MSNVVNTHPLLALFHKQRYFSSIGTLATGVAHLPEHAVGLRESVEDQIRVKWGRGASKVLTFEERDHLREATKELVLRGYVFSEKDLQELLKAAFKLGQQNPNR